MIAKVIVYRGRWNGPSEDFYKTFSSAPHLRQHSDHPNARGQKKRRVEEKGPFGKANRRKGSSRTRTVTPAKKENPTLDSFGRALFYDQQRRPYSPPNRASNDTNNSPNVSSADKQPTQVVLSGYQPDFQWQAISKYEKISRGMICEYYEREPPIEYHRYPNAISQSPYRRPRPLTKEERGMVNRFAGGENWIKVTFDSMVAAELAMMKSPIQVNQHWVYAQPYQGFGPVVDQPIPMSEEERIALNPSEKSIQLSKLAQPLALEQQQEVGSSMSNNVSSGNSMGTQTSDLRNRNISHTQEQTHNPQMMRFFPDTPRTILRPAHEALLPQPSWWERQVAWLTERGLIPAEIIGNGPRTLENGDFDWQNSSFYWKFWYLFDRAFETDMCGLRPEEGEEDL